MLKFVVIITLQSLEELLLFHSNLIFIFLSAEDMRELVDCTHRRTHAKPAQIEIMCKLNAKKSLLTCSGAGFLV